MVYWWWKVILVMVKVKQAKQTWRENAQIMADNTWDLVFPYLPVLSSALIVNMFFLWTKMCFYWPAVVCVFGCSGIVCMAGHDPWAWPWQSGVLVSDVDIWPRISNIHLDHGWLKLTWPRLLPRNVMYAVACTCAAFQAIYTQVIPRISANILHRTNPTLTTDNIPDSLTNSLHSPNRDTTPT